MEQQAFLQLQNYKNFSSENIYSVLIVLLNDSINTNLHFQPTKVFRVTVRGEENCSDALL